MKKLFAILLCAAVLMALPFGQIASAQTTDQSPFAQTEDYTDMQAYAFLQQFVTQCPNRHNSEDQLHAAEWLADQFSQLGLTATVMPVGEGNTIYGYNMQAVLQASQPTDQQIIIGAHYDSIGEGASDNASGVTAMYLVCQSLVQSGAQLPFNVVFVAFGAEEQGLIGSQYYVSSMSAAQRQNTMVMFNLDSVAGGDNLYLFCENKPTDLANFVLGKADNVQIYEKPHAVGVFPLEYYGYGYYETVQGSDHTPFRLVGIATATFFSGNFSWWNYVQSTDDNKVVMNSNSDTLQSAQTNWGAAFFQRTQDVADILVATLCDGNFVAIAQNASSQLVNGAIFNGNWALLMVAGLIGLCVLFGWLYYRKLQKASILGHSAASPKQSVFTKPDVEDIFTFDDK